MDAMVAGRGNGSCALLEREQSSVLGRAPTGSMLTTNTLPHSVLQLQRPLKPHRVSARPHHS